MLSGTSSAHGPRFQETATRGASHCPRVRLTLNHNPSKTENVRQTFPKAPDLTLFNLLETIFGRIMIKLRFDLFLGRGVFWGGNERSTAPRRCLPLAPFSPFSAPFLAILQNILLRYKRIHPKKHTETLRHCTTRLEHTPFNTDCMHAP
jgi:hypothetical protein